MNWTRAAVAELLRARGLKPRRALGQNFLVDPNFLEALARDTEAGPADTVVEIGSGLGNLTERLAARARHVWAFDVDPHLHALSKELLAGTPNVTFVLADGAEFERHVPPGPLRVASNLPYFDWQRLVLRLLSTPRDVLSYTFMVQADLYDRLCARPGSRDYGPMPALLQAAGDLTRLRRAGKGLFLPPPRVDSVVFRLRRRRVLDFVAAHAALARLFAGRRKKSAAAGGRRVESLLPAELLDLALSH